MPLESHAVPVWTRAKPRRSYRQITMIWSVRLLALLATAWAVEAGVALRSLLWNWSSPIRFTGDITNGWRQGELVVRDACTLSGKTAGTLTFHEFFRGYQNRYSVVQAASENDRYSLDYTPARLLVMSLWTWQIKRSDPSATEYDDANAGPLLNMNTACELGMAAFMFLLVRYWARRERIDRYGKPGEMPWMLGAVAAWMVIFNPALLVDGHMWPQWDCWTLPGYVAAAWLASTGWWFSAGISIAVAAMFKGQVMMVAPVLMLWPLFAGWWVAAWRIVVGLAFGFAAMASIWLVPDVDELWWLLSLVIASVAAVLVVRRKRWRSRWAWPVWGLIPLAVCAAWPLLGPGFGREEAGGLVGMVLLLPALARWMSRTSCAVWIAGIVAAAIFIGARPFGGTWSWFQVGFMWPTYHFGGISHNCSNLPQWLAQRYRFQLHDPISTPAVWLIPSVNFDFKSLLICIYGTTLVLCAIGAAIHSRRNSARLLVALAAPWILMFTLLAQMHERYLLWGAAAGVMVVGTSLGMGLLQGVIIALGTISIYKVMLSLNGGFEPQLYLAMRNMYPQSAWMLMLAAAVFSVRRRLAAAASSAI